MRILNRISDELKKCGKSQKDLTDFLGISKNVFTDWKSGKCKSYTKHLPQISEFLGVSTDYLLGNSNYNNQAILTPHELEVLIAYRNKPEMQKAVDRLLCVEEISDVSDAANIGADITSTLAAVPQTINKK